MKRRKRTSRKGKTFPTFPVAAGALPGTFKVDPDDEMIPVHNAAGRDSLIEKAASIVLPLLRAKKVTPRMIKVLLEEILKARKEISKSDRPDLIEYLRSIPTEEGLKRTEALIWQHGGPVYGADPADPDSAVIIEHHRDGTKRRGHFVGGKFVPLLPETKTPAFDAKGYQSNIKDLNGEALPDLKKLQFRPRVRKTARLKVLDELAKQAQELKMGYGADDPAPSIFEKIRAFRSRQKPLSPGEAKKLIGAGRHRLRRKRVLSPKFKKLMAKKTAGSAQADLDAVRGDL